MEAPLLEVKNLKTYFFNKEGIVKAVDGISFTVSPKTTVGIVGESGCGKSVTALSILRLIKKPGQIMEGEIFFKGENIMEKSPAQIRKIRGNQISMIFQEPMVSLNPVFTVGYQIMEPLQFHFKLEESEAKARALELLDRVGISSPKERIGDYPHQLSGGQQQRIMIAMALACSPQLLIADEPTTALDVTIEAQILKLLNELQQELGTAIILITHDLGVIAETCAEVNVMYLGKIVEKAEIIELFKNPLHPYTRGLLDSIPKINAPVEKYLYTIKGSVPSPVALGPGCNFYNRCPYAFDKCRQEPPLQERKPGHLAACWKEELDHARLSTG